MFTKDTLNVGDKFYPEKEKTFGVQHCLLVVSVTLDGIRYLYGSEVQLETMAEGEYPSTPLGFDRLKSWCNEYSCKYVPAFVLVDHELID